MDWSLFDCIYCINLTTRPDRRELVQTVFDKYNIPVTFYLVDPHPKSGVRGCFESHVAIINEAYHKNYNHVLIFEDDVVATPMLTNEHYEHTLNFMQNNNDWEIFYYSMAPEIFWTRMKHVENNIYKVHSYWGSSYVLSRKGIERYHNLQYTGTEIDCIYRDNNNAYGHCPSFFYQHNTSSNLRDHVKTYNDQCPNTLEWYATTVNVPCYWFLVILVVIVILFLLVVFIYKL